MSAVSIADARPWPASGQPFTVDDLDRLPDDGRRCELLEGALIVSPRPTTTHQAVATQLTVALSIACPRDLIVVAEPAVKLNSTTELDPDIVVVPRAHVGGAKFTEPPLLVVEVRSPRTALIDLNSKKAAYERFGVASYWIVVPHVDKPELLVFELREGKYEQTVHVIGDAVFQASVPFPVEVVPARLVAGLPPD
jgi:Uma2 family endonuclease